MLETLNAFIYTYTNILEQTSERSPKGGKEWKNANLLLWDHLKRNTSIHKKVLHNSFEIFAEWPTPPFKDDNVLPLQIHHA